jgi:cell fate regulator YaaT (PSP1 superfamily)
MEEVLLNVVKLQFSNAGKLYDFYAGDLDLHPGDKVIVETERGRSVATVVVSSRSSSKADLPEGLKTVLRKALPEDLEASSRNTAREKDAFDFCLAKIKERGMEMKLIRAEYLFDGSKVIFYFTADGRVDFRELVKDLAHAFHTRIEMRQIGRELCCSSFLRDFEPVSVKMAKEQNLALNPTKISGQCGRLLCCLGYEFETYCTLRKCLPKCGKRVQCGGVDGEVIKLNVLDGTVTVKTDDDQQVVIKGDDIKPENITDRPKKPPKEGPAPNGKAPKERRPETKEKDKKEKR